MAVKAIPDGYHTVTPYLIIDGAAAAIDFYRRAFGAVEVVRMADANGRLMHAEIRIGDCMVMMADEHHEMGNRGPATLGGTTVSLVLYVPDVDAVFDRAIRAGGKSLRPVTDQFYGDRMGTLEDPFGHVWTVGTHTEDLSPEEMKKRMAAAHA
jgi:PhnB protein